MRDDRLWKDETILVILRIRSMISFFLSFFFFLSKCPLFLPTSSTKQPNTQTQWKTPSWKQFVSVVTTGKEDSSLRAYYSQVLLQFDAGFRVLRVGAI